MYLVGWTQRIDERRTFVDADIGRHNVVADELDPFVRLYLVSVRHRHIEARLCESARCGVASPYAHLDEAHTPGVVLAHEPDERVSSSFHAGFIMRHG